MIEYLLNADAMTSIKSTISNITYAIFAVCGALVGLYAIWIGYKMATAQDDGARTQAKAQLISAIIGFVIIGAMAGLKGITGLITNGVTVSDYGVTGSGKLITAINTAVSSITDVIMSCAMLFGLYLGWNFMKADDDTKRKQAKTQLIYTMIAIVVMIMIGSLGTMLVEMGKP